MVGKIIEVLTVGSRKPIVSGAEKGHITTVCQHMSKTMPVVKPETWNTKKSWNDKRSSKQMSVLVGVATKNSNYHVKGWKW